ncbi:flagellar motor switch protein FliG [Pseudodonghicola flavimaris]|uniref:Flagellar motor switch protein FliG n=1 Tax=Pseudodonghicola flavimaris TaxID=3050036 RepID=A0ABT7EWH5_9RHOB|nr:flagellar motor switch protein FliG [Pseudodonghicola flavimaris]MDK3016697.1 flagellar motor switch protein FliG [Pseudodonghicola flavimaris]
MNHFSPLRKHRPLSGAEKSAILFLCLGEERGGALMQQLDVGEIRKITRAISAMGEVPAEVVEEVMREFGEKMSSYGGITGSVEAARGLLKGFLPEDRVAEILDEIEDSATGNLWGDLSELDEKILTDFLRKEHNQTVAVILTRIRADTAAKVLPLLGQDRAVDLIERMVAMESLPAEALRSIEESLRREVLAKAGRNAGAETEKQLVMMFNKLDSKVFEGLSRELERKIPAEFRTIKQKMFVFGDLIELKPATLAKVMREVSGKTLPLALRGAEKELRDHFLASLPARSRDMLEEEMRSMGPVKTRDVKQAQSELVEAAIRLASEGEIELPSGDEEDMID